MIPTGRFREALEYLEARGAPCIRASVQVGAITYSGLSMAEAQKISSDFSFRGIPATYDVRLDEDALAFWVKEQRDRGAEIDTELLGVTA